LRFNFTDRSRIAFIKHISGCDQVGRFLARELDVVRTRAIAVRAPVN
jgi:hypothetical protein